MSNKLFHVELGHGAKGLVSALRKNFKIETIKFKGHFCLMGYGRKNRGEAQPDKIFSCPKCKFSQTEKPGKVCANCGHDINKLKGKNLENFLEDNVYKRFE